MYTYKFMVLLECNSRLIINKRLKWSTGNIKLFAALYDLSLSDWRRYRYENKIPALTEEQIRATAYFRESIGISKEEWLKYPSLIKQLACTVEQHYLQLKEGGFIKINAGILAHYRKFIHKKIGFLKLNSFIGKDVNVAESFLAYLNPKPSALSIDDLTDEKAFEDIHHSILTRYIMWRCDVTQDEVEKFYRIYSLTRIKSFGFLCQNFAIAEDLGFPPKKILKYGYLLTNNPNYTKTVLTTMPTIAGGDVRKAMKMYPKLIGVPPDHYKEIYDYLKKEKVPDSTIKRCMNIFTVSPKTVKVRFEEIKTVPDLRVLLHNPTSLKLIVHHNQARSRLSFLKELKLNCASTTMLANGNDVFNIHVRGGKDVNNTREILSFLKQLLKSESKEIEVNLKKHKYFRHVPLVEIEKSYKFLKDMQFSNQSIVDAIQVLLYPSPKISEALKKVDDLKFTDKQKLSMIEQLNLMLYFLEKEHHFTGNGIWENY